MWILWFFLKHERLSREYYENTLKKSDWSKQVTYIAILLSNKFNHAVIVSIKKL